MLSLLYYRLAARQNFVLARSVNNEHKYCVTLIHTEARLYEETIVCSQDGAKTSRASDESQSQPTLGLKRTQQRYVLSQPNSHSSPLMLATKSS